MAPEGRRQGERIFFGQGNEDVIEMPNLIDIQLGSYERFLQKKRLDAGEPPFRG